MDDYILYNNLYDCYFELLTDKQRKYFEDYYFKNLSLGEMSEDYQISRNAIYKQIQITTKKLREYEEKLNLYKKKQKLEEIIEQIEDENIKKKLEVLI